MPLTADDFKRRYAELSNEGLLAINPDELTPLARGVYDQELAERKLVEAPAEAEESELGAEGAHVPADEPEDTADPMVEIAKCATVEEAVFYRELMRQAGIEAVIPTRGQFSVNWAGVSSTAEVPLTVRQSQVKEATEIMDASISDDELAAQAEAAAPHDIEPEEEDIDPE